MAKSYLRLDYEKRKKEKNTANTAVDRTNQKLQSVFNTVKTLDSGWKSAEEINSLKSDIFSVQQRLTARKSQSKSKEEISQIDSWLSALSEADSYVGQANETYSKFKTADEYNTAFKNSQYSEKYKSATTYNDVNNIINSADYSKLDDEEKKWLNSYRWQVATSDELQKEYDALDSLDLDNQITPKNIRLLEIHSALANEKGDRDALIKEQEALEKEVAALTEKQGLMSVLKTAMAERRAEEEFNSKWGNITVPKEFKATVNTEEKDEYYREINGLGQDLIGKFFISKDGEKAKSLDYVELMDKDQKSKYNSIYETEGIEKANEYFKDLISVSLDKKKNNELMQQAFDFTSQNGWTGAVGSVGSVVTSLGSGLEYVANLATGQGDRRSTLSSVTTGLREGTKENWNGAKAEKVWDFLYDTGMSGVDSVAAVGVSAATGLPFAGEFLLGSSAAANTANDLLDRGVTGGDVVLASLAAGAAESIFEHLSIGKILGTGGITKGFTKEGIKQAVKKVGTDMLVNLSEEALTEVANIISDELINGELSSYAVAVKNYYTQDGLSIEEAKAKAAKDMGVQIGMAGLSGMLMGFGFGVGGSVVGLSSSQIKNSKNGNAVLSGNNLGVLKTMAKASGFSEIIEAAEKLTESSKPSEVGYVFNRLYEKSVEKSVQEMAPELMKNGATKGGTNAASSWAMQIIKSATVSQKTKSNVMNDLVLRTNKVTKDVYSAFVDEGKFGGDVIFALNEIRTSPVNQAVAQTNSESATTTPENAAGQENKNSAPKTTAEIYGQMVKDHLEKVNPTPARPTTKQITPAGEAIVKAVGKSMGVDVVFTDEAVDGIADGKTEDGNTVYISRYTVDPIKVVIKHEFTHSVEGSRLYEKFSNYIFEDSVAFENWLKEKGYSHWVEAVRNELDKFKEHGIKYKDPYYMAKTEVIAKFVSETLFTDKNGNNGEIASNFLAELRRVDRAWYERFIDWVKSVFARLKETDAVNKDIIKLEQKFLRLVETVDRNNDSTDETEKVNQYSFVGEKAKTADKMKLSTAKQMLKDGVDSETIRQDTGWFKGYDGKWRFEISDKELHIKRSFYKNAIISGQYTNALRKRAGVKTSKEETARFLELLKEYMSIKNSDMFLTKYINHEQLFKAYPELKDVTVTFNLPEASWSGMYYPEERKIVINCAIVFEENMLQGTLIHEIQHAIQCIEGFERGASNIYWERQKEKSNTFRNEDGTEPTAHELYMRTAGEIEAEDSKHRWKMSDAERKTTRPDIDRTDVVFASTGQVIANENTRYSIPSDHTFVYNQGKASFTEQRLLALLDEHSLGDGKRAEHSNAYVGYISPEEFLNLTANDKIRGRVEDEAYVLNEKELERESETPFLEYDPSNGRVVNHEGRHRMVALKADGISSVAMVLKPSDDSFKPRAKRDISLTGQSFADSNASGNVMVKNALPLSEKYRAQITAEFAKNPDADIRYSIPGKITPNMSEQERYELLKDRTIQVAIADLDKIDSILFEHSDLRGKKLKKSEVTKILKKIGEEFDVYHQYANADMEVNFEFGKNNMDESVTKQKGNYDIFAQMLSCFSDVISNAIGIEVHNRNAEGYKPDPTLKNVYVLCSAFENEENVIPVKLSIKEFSDKPNRLYVAVALEGIKKDRVVSMGVPNNRSHIRTSPVTVSISEIFKNVNEKDKDFIKYIPSQFFTDKNSKYSLPENAIGKSREELKVMVESGEITLDEAFESLADQYGTLPKGENPKVDVSFPKKISKNESVSRFARTVAESGHLDQGMSERQQKELLNGAMSYQVISDKDALAKADTAIKEDFPAAVSRWEDIINSGKLMGKNDIALGERLLQQAAEHGNTNDVMKYIAELSELGSRMGQNIQALSLLKRMTGIGQLYYMSRVVESLNRDIQKRFGNKHQIIEIDSNFANILANSTNPTEIEAVVDDLIKDVASKIPSTLLDKWNAWRYLAMLGNPRTHVRNFVGNVVFVPAVRIANGMSYMIERFRPKEQRTKVLGLLKPEYKAFAKEDFKKVQDILTGGGKMNPTDRIREQQKIFKNKALEKMRKANSDFMEAEDLVFLKMHYVRALGGLLQARGLSINALSEAQLNEARLYAINEAQKATYRDTSALAEALNRFQYSDKKSVRAAGMMLDGILPFKKTPINILKRGVEYSPFGLITGLTKGVYDLKKGNINANQFIDKISAGLTGTGIMALGALLYSLGLVVGGLDYEDEDALERMAGAQAYSIEVGDVSYTIDWMAPAVLPFLVGAEVQKFLSSEEERSTISFFIDALTAIGEPMTELSMLSGLNDAIEAVSYSENKLTDMVLSTALSYASQGLPTLGGQIARTLDKTRRSSYVDKNSAVPTSVQNFYQKALGKIPFAENTKIPYIDAWGQEESNGNVAERAFENFASPGYASAKINNTVNNEVARLFVETDNKGVVPKKAGKSFEVNNVTKHLTAEEYVTYAKAKGQKSYAYAEELFKHPLYKKLDDNQKAEVLTELYSFANAKAKAEVSDYDYESNTKYKAAAKLEKAGIDPISFYIARVLTSVENADTDGSGTVSKKEYTDALKQSGLSAAIRKRLLEQKYKN